MIDLNVWITIPWSRAKSWSSKYYFTIKLLLSLAFAVLHYSPIAMFQCDPLKGQITLEYEYLQIFIDNNWRSYLEFVLHWTHLITETIHKNMPWASHMTRGLWQAISLTAYRFWYAIRRMAYHRDGQDHLTRGTINVNLRNVYRRKRYVCFVSGWPFLFHSSWVFFVKNDNIYVILSLDSRLENLSANPLNTKPYQ